MGYFQNYQHIIFRTDHSMDTIPECHKRELLAYIFGINEKLGVKTLRLNAYLNHVHLFVNIPPQLSISEYVKKVKGSSSKSFQGHKDFPFFKGWARKFGSISKSESDKEKIINYIKGQEEHHRHKTFQEELEELFGEEYFKDPQNRHDWFDEPLPSSNTVG